MTELEAATFEYSRLEWIQRELYRRASGARFMYVEDDPDGVEINRPDSKTVERLLPAIYELSDRDRLYLASLIVQSVPDPDVQYDPEFIAELNRRIRAIESGEDRGIRCEEVMERLRMKFAATAEPSDRPPSSPS